MKNNNISYLSGRFFDGISSGLFMMALPWFILSEPGRGPFVAMVALTCTVVTFFLTPFISAWIDRYSRKQLLVVNMVIQTLVSIIVAMAYALDIGNHWLLGASQVIYWVSINMAWHTNNAFTQENWDVEDYNKISGHQEIVGQVTLLGSGAVGVMLLDLWGMTEFALFAAIASALSVLAYGVTPYRRKLRETARVSIVKQIIESKDVFKNQKLLFTFIVFSQLAYPVLTFVGQLVPIWFAEQGYSGQWYATYNTAMGLGALIIGFFITRVLDKFEHVNVIRNSLLVMGFAILMMGAGFEPWVLIVFASIFASFKSMARITRITLMHNHVDSRVRGRADGGLAMLMTAIQSVGYLIIAHLTSTNQTQLGFYIAGGVLLVSFVVTTVIGSMLKKQFTSLQTA